MLKWGIASVVIFRVSVSLLNKLLPHNVSLCQQSFSCLSYKVLGNGWYIYIYIYLCTPLSEVQQNNMLFTTVLGLVCLFIDIYQNLMYSWWVNCLPCPQNK